MGGIYQDLPGISSLTGNETAAFDTGIAGGSSFQTVKIPISQIIAFSPGLRIISGSVTSDTASVSDSTISWQSAQAVRTETIPSAGSVLAGKVLNIVDGNGTANVTNTITISPVSGTINGNSTLVINVARTSYRLIADGISNWIIT